jgi:hypothetical protein
MEDLIVLIDWWPADIGGHAPLVGRNCQFLTLPDRENCDRPTSQARMGFCFGSRRLRNSRFNSLNLNSSLCYFSGMQDRQNGVSKLARGTSGGANPECWVDDHGDYLYRYALVPVPYPEVSEDLV